MIRTAWTLGAVLAGLALVFATYSQTWRTAMKAPPLDLVVDWGGARVLLDGGDPFDEADVEASGVADHLRQLRLRPGAGLAHPPTAFVWFLPLAPFPLAEARVIWAHLTLLFAFLLALVAARELALPSPLASALLLFGWIGTSSWFAGHLAVGQLSVLLALLITLGWSRWRIGDDLGGGALLGLACTLKVFPGAIVLYFLIARRFRLVAAAVGAWLLVAVPVTVHVGVDDWGRFLAEAGEYTDQWIGHVRNGSLLGIFQRARHSVCELPPSTTRSGRWPTCSRPRSRRPASSGWCGAAPTWGRSRSPSWSAPTPGSTTRRCWSCRSSSPSPWSSAAAGSPGSPSRRRWSSSASPGCSTSTGSRPAARCTSTGRTRAAAASRSSCSPPPTGSRRSS